MTQIESKVVHNVLSTNTPSISVKPFSRPCISSEKKKSETKNQHNNNNQPTSQGADCEELSHSCLATLWLKYICQVRFY